MIGKIFITRMGYDPQLGKHVKDPYLGEVPSLGACRPDIRKAVSVGDHIFVVSGRVPGHNQFVIGGFEVARKTTATEAFRVFPSQRLRRRPDGQLTGNVIVDRSGRQSSLDDHKNYERRLDNYIVGKNPIVLASNEEIVRGRDQTAKALRVILGRNGATPVEIIGRWGCTMTDRQVRDLLAWLKSLKAA